MIEQDYSLGTLHRRFSPQKDSLVYPIFGDFVPLAASTLAANDARGVRVLVPRSGTLVDLHVFVSVSSGNIEAGVFSLADPRVDLYDTGTIACPAAGAWRKLGDPNIAVRAGQQLDFVLSCDNITASFGRAVTGLAAACLSLPTTFFPDPLGGAADPILGWNKAASFDLSAASFTDATIAASSLPIALIARVA